MIERDNYFDNDRHVSTEWLSLALDGMLQPAEQQSFDLHLQGCPSCQLRWSKWQRISSALWVEPFAGPMPDFTLKVDSLVQQSSRRRERMLGGAVVVGGAISIWSIVLLSAALTIGIWLFVTPAARLQLMEVFGFGGQLVALMINNLDALRGAVAAVLPSPAALAGFALVVAIMASIWVWVIFFTGHGSAQAGVKNEGR